MHGSNIKRQKQRVMISSVIYSFIAVKVNICQFKKLTPHAFNYVRLNPNEFSRN